MKKSYTTFIPKKRILGDTDKEELKFAVQKARETEVLAEGDKKDDLRLKLADLLVHNCVRSDGCSHVYVQDVKFAEWLSGCAKTLSGDHILLLQETVHKHGFVYHFPCGGGWDSFTFMALNSGKDASEGKATNAILQMSRTALAERGSGIVMNLSLIKNYSDAPDLNTMPHVKKHLQFALGLATYVTCFPETVKAGVPEDLKHPSQHQAKQILTVGVSEKISLGGTHASPVSHFRTGHFRVLKSERFTNKRFEVIFVHETFVKGKAVTVLSPEEEAVQQNV